MVPFEEDGWESFEVIRKGDKDKVAAKFGKDVIGLGKGIYTIIRCARCMVPNIDPETGVRDPFVSTLTLFCFLHVYLSCKVTLSCCDSVEESRPDG